MIKKIFLVIVALSLLGAGCKKKPSALTGTGDGNVALAHSPVKPLVRGPEFRKSVARNCLWGFPYPEKFTHMTVW